MKRLLPLTLMTLAVAGCASTSQREAITTVSPAKCYYDSNLNRQRCSHAVTAGGIATSDPRAYRANVDGNIFDDYHKKPTKYVFGYDARFEAGYRAPTRFDTTIYDKSVFE